MPGQGKHGCMAGGIEGSNNKICWLGENLWKCGWPSIPPPLHPELWRAWWPEDCRRTVNPTRQPWKSNKWYNFYMLMSEDFDATCQHCQDSPIRKELMPCGTPWRAKNAWAMSQISIAIGDQTTESIQNHPKRGITWPLEKISICNTQKPKMINLWHSLGGGTLSCWTSMFTKLFKCRKMGRQSSLHGDMGNGIGS